MRLMIKETQNKRVKGEGVKGGKRGEENVGQDALCWLNGRLVAAEGGNRGWKMELCDKRERERERERERKKNYPWPANLSSAHTLSINLVGGSKRKHTI